MRGSRMRRMGAHVCRVRRALRLLHSRRGCTCKQITRPSASASARVQVDGGAVSMGKGALVFDGVAISDTSATARRPSAARAGRPLRLRARGGPAPDRRRVQGDGGAVYMGDGAVTFRGSSTITRTRAVRPALPNAHAHARTWSTSLRC